MTGVRDNVPLHFEGLVAKNMDTEVLAGIPFFTQNDISVHPARKLVMIGKSTYPYGGTSTKSCVARAVIARYNSPMKTIWPGDYLEATCDINPSEDTEIAVEPHLSSTIPTTPIVTTCLKGKIRLLNDTKYPLHINKNQHVGQVVQTICPNENPSLLPPLEEKPIKSPKINTSSIDTISINPDNEPEILQLGVKIFCTP